MRSQASSSRQSPGQISDHKKSVFDRLGRQLEPGQFPMRRGTRPSSPGGGPGTGGAPYIDYMPPPPGPPMIDEAFGRYSRDPQAMSEMDWRYHSERRQAGFGVNYGRDRHPSHIGLPPPPRAHYDVELVNRHGSYHTMPHPYYGGPNLGAGPPMPGIHQQRSSPKYDRHGNPVNVGPPDRVSLGLGDHHLGTMSPPRNFIHSSAPMMHSVGHPHPELTPPPPPPGSMPVQGMYPISGPRWHDNVAPEFSSVSHMTGRMLSDSSRFSPSGMRRYDSQQLSVSGPGGNSGGGGKGRHTKWRERRHKITNLDRETAQSSSRTDSLKSTLQQADARSKSKVSDESNKAIANRPQNSVQSIKTGSSINISQSQEQSTSASSEKKDANVKDGRKDASSVRETGEISEGEIVDDDDDDDDDDVDEDENVNTGSSKLARESTAVINRENGLNSRDSFDKDKNDRSQNLLVSSNVAEMPERAHQQYEPAKKRRMIEREEYSMEYETISDDDLDVFMGDKKDFDDDDVKLNEQQEKNLSEVALLNALGLDWGHLVEMARQTKTCKDSYTPGSALPRFSIFNYIPTLGITPDLAGPEIYDLILKICRH